MGRCVLHHVYVKINLEVIKAVKSKIKCFLVNPIKNLICKRMLQSFCLYEYHTHTARQVKQCSRNMNMMNDRRVFETENYHVTSPNNYKLYTRCCFFLAYTLTTEC